MRKKHYKAHSNELISLVICIGLLVRGVFKAILTLLTAIYEFIFGKKNEVRYTYRDVINVTRNMDSRKFEIFCAELFKYSGFKNVKVTKATNDYGRDIIMQDKNNKTVYVECKHYNSSVVGREICQKLLGSMAMFGVEKGIIISTGKFNANAKEVAKMCPNLTLMSGDDIMCMIYKMKNCDINKMMLRLKNCA